MATRELVSDAIEASRRGFEALRGDLPEQMDLGGLFDQPISIKGRQVEPEELDAIVERRAGRGRPKGATNKATREWREWWLSRGVDPVTDAIRWLQVGPEVLAGYLGCSKAEAWDRLQRMREFVAPYLFARMAQTDDQGNAVPTFNISFGGPRDASGQEIPPWLEASSLAKPVEQNQALTAPEDARSQSGESQ